MNHATELVLLVTAVLMFLVGQAGDRWRLWDFAWFRFLGASLTLTWFIFFLRSC